MMLKQKYWLCGVLILVILFISGCLKSSEEPEITIFDILEEDIPEIKNYSKLEQVFIDLHSADGFSKEEIDFMKVSLEIYKETPKLEEYPKEALIYLMSRTIGRQSFHDTEFFNKTLIPLAKDITKETENDLEAMQAIHKWVNENIEYGYTDYPIHEPEDILREKKGVCEHYAILIISLAKAVGIPARYLSSNHAWVEAYVDGDWIPIASTGALDNDHDGIITYSDLMTHKNNMLVDVFIKSPYHPRHSRTDITFGYNNHIFQQMIIKVEDMLEENYNLEAEDNLNSAKNTIALWKTKESTEDRNKIGRDAMEHLLKAVAILEESVTGDEVYVAFLEDFPLVHPNTSSREFISGFWTEEIAQSADIKNPLVFWEDFQKDLVEKNPKVLYIFDAAYETQTLIFFAQPVYAGVDLRMLQKINELIKDKGLNTDLNFILYWLGKESSETIEFLEYENIEPTITLTKVFEDNAEDFMWAFVEAINSVKNNITKTTFYLPPKFEDRYPYHISAVGTGPSIADPHPGYYLQFRFVTDTSIGKLPLRLDLHMIPGVTNENNFPRYTNLIIVDELGNVTSPDEKNGKYYYSVCPSKFVNLAPGQNLLIEREGDFVKITEIELLEGHTPL